MTPHGPHLRKLVEGYRKLESDLNELCLEPTYGDSRNTQVQSAESLRECVGDIQELKSLSKNLGILKKNLDSHIGRQRDKVLPAAYRHGFMSLPSEIFLLILMELFALYEDPFRGAWVIIRDLSLVSRSLRAVILQFTKVWTYLDLNNCGPELLDLFLRRSGNCPLSVRFMYFPWTEKNILYALSSRDRWGLLRANFVSDPKLSEYLMPKCLEKLPSMSFPTVRTLQVQVRDMDSRWQFPDWSFPNATDVCVAGASLKPHHFGCDSLKKFQYLSTPSEVDTSGSFLGNVIGVLRPAICLNTLVLDVSFISMLEGVDLLVEVELPSVTNFIISNWRRGDTWKFLDVLLPMEDFIGIVRTMKLPNVHSISISHAFAENTFRLEEWLNKAFPPSHVSDALTCLVFRIQFAYEIFEEGERAVVHVDEFFRHFPTLVLLELDAGDCDVEFNGGAEVDSSAFRNLRSFRIKFDGSDRRQLYELLEFLARNGAPLFEIDITSTYKFDEEKIKRIFPTANIRLSLY